MPEETLNRHTDGVLFNRRNNDNTPEEPKTTSTNSQASSSGKTDLFFYNKDNGVAEFYKLGDYGHGDMTLVKRYTSWASGWSGWDIIVPGQFGGDAQTDFLFYDSYRGYAEIYTSQGGGNLSLVKKYTGWRKSWNIIVAGQYGGDGLTDLMFYDRSSGEAEIYASTGNGNLSSLKRYTGWEKGSSGWDIIITGPFGPDDQTGFLFYDNYRGVGEFYSNSNGSLSLLKRYTGWQKKWDNIVVTKNTDVNGIYAKLEFYDKNDGYYENYSYISNGDMRLHYYGSHYTGFDIVVPGDFVKDELEDILYYGDGRGYFYDGPTLVNKYSGWDTGWDTILPVDIY